MPFNHARILDRFMTSPSGWRGAVADGTIGSTWCGFGTAAARNVPQFFGACGADSGGVQQLYRWRTAT